jgi:hypothetical protein
MDYSRFELYKFYQIALDSSLIKIYGDLIKDYPKPKKVSSSVYLICLAIKLLENLGNQFPSQKEIDAIQAILKKYNRYKEIKVIFKKACSSSL